MNRRTEAAKHLRDRLRETDGLVATITRDDEVVAQDIDVVRLDVSRIVRNESDALIEADEVAFLVGVDVVPDPPEIGDEFAIGGILYRVLERNDIETHWRWHGKTRIQRVVFCKEWADE